MGVLCDNGGVDFGSRCPVEEPIRGDGRNHAHHRNSCPLEHHPNAALMQFAPIGPNGEVAEYQRAEEKNQGKKEHRESVQKTETHKKTRQSRQQ